MKCIYIYYIYWNIRNSNDTYVVLISKIRGVFIWTYPWDSPTSHRLIMMSLFPTSKQLWEVNLTFQTHPGIMLLVCQLI